MYYHVWSKTKQSKWLLLGDAEKAVNQTISDVARRHGIRLLECETMVDHVHMLVNATDDTELSKAMHLLKGASARRLMESIPDIRMDADVNHFWQKRYSDKPIEPSALPGVAHYIRTQNRRPDKYER